jgi:hypothetical protein
MSYVVLMDAVVGSAAAWALRVDVDTEIESSRTGYTATARRPTFCGKLE